MSVRSAGLDLAEYEALLRADLAGFAERAFCELYPQTDFLANWHHRVITANRVRKNSVTAEKNVEPSWLAPS